MHAVGPVEAFGVGTSQSQVRKAYGNTYDKVKARPFASEQFDRFKHTLKVMKPKVVLVANACASDIAVKEPAGLEPAPGVTLQHSLSSTHAKARHSGCTPMAGSP